MSTFKAIPQPTDQRNVSQNDILTNFAYLNNASGAADSGILPVDHISTGDNVSNQSCGFHKQISFLDRTSPANLINSVTTVASSSIAYTKTDGDGKSQLRFKNSTLDAPITGLLAYVNFDNTGTAIGTPFNCTIVRTSVGRFTITFTAAPANTQYLILCSCDRSTPGTSPIIINYGNKAAGSFDIRTFLVSVGSIDPIEASVMVYRFV